MNRQKFFQNANCENILLAEKLLRFRKEQYMDFIYSEIACCQNNIHTCIKLSTCSWSNVSRVLLAHFRCSQLIKISLKTRKADLIQLSAAESHRIFIYSSVYTISMYMLYTAHKCSKAFARGGIKEQRCLGAQRF